MSVKSLFQRLLFVILFFSSLVTAKPKVAVLFEKDLFNFAGQPTLRPHKVGEFLKEYGFEAENINADQMGDPSFFNVKNFDAIVLAYGNAFPLVGYKNLRKFHVDGGTLVVNGIPFTHPAERKGKKWIDQGHVNYLQHDEKGIGTGNFLGGTPGVVGQRVAENNRLGMTLEILPRTNENIQFLNPKALPSEDISIPIVEAKYKEDLWYPATAIIKHKCELFKGAYTLWLGQIGKQLEPTDYYYLQQVIVRGLGYIFNDQGKITNTEFDKIKSELDKQEKPSPLPSNIKPVKEERPWGDTFLPKSKEPAEHLWVVDADKRRADERIALACLQGLTSRKQPQIWLHYDKMNCRFWLDWHKEKGHIKSYTVVNNWEGIFKKFSDSYKGAVIPDTSIHSGELIAANVAACEDLLVLSPRLTKELEIPVVMDLRGKFATYAEGMKWVWDTYKDELNHFVFDCIHPSLLQNGCFAYDIQWKNIMFWISGPVDSVEPGADPLEETRVMAEIFASTPPNTAFLGFPYRGEGVGMGEVGGTSFCGGYGKSLVCTDRLANACVTSGVHIDKFQQKPQPSAAKLEKDKVYIALVYSDGDNINMWRDTFVPIFKDDLMGKFPVSFGIGPAIYDLQPAVAQWYYEKAPATTEFICDVSGIGYMRPDDYAIKFENPENILEGFIEWTEKYCEKMDLKSVRPVEANNEILKMYIEFFPAMHSVFTDMGRAGGYNGQEELTYQLDGMKIFRAQTTWSKGAEGIIEEVREQVGRSRPAFVNAFAHVWTLRSLNKVKEHFVDKMDEDMVLVTPAQLAELYQEAIDKGWAD